MKTGLRILALVVSSPLWLACAALVAAGFIIIGIPVLTIAFLVNCIEFAITGKWQSPWAMLKS